MEDPQRSTIALFQQRASPSRVILTVQAALAGCAPVDATTTGNVVPESTRGYVSGGRRRRALDFGCDLYVTYRSEKVVGRGGRIRTGDPCAQDSGLGQESQAGAVPPIVPAA